MIELECHIIIKRNGISFLDAVKTELLEEIIKCGSLSSASKNLKISYQHAWNMIDLINKVASEPLVNLSRGGANGGGAIITLYGKKTLKEFKLIEAEINKRVDQINVEINL